jgi:septum formation inhibitor-activating ATPase MinD
MSILKKATNEMSRLKAGIQGSAGSGKTRTAAELAIGLAQLHKKPVAVCDSESGTDYLILSARDILAVVG